MSEIIKIKQLGLQNYDTVWQALKSFTQQRDATTIDELWLLEHKPVYTQGQAGRPEHILDPRDIPVIRSDRGGQATYHGPGQLIVYFLLDIARKSISIRNFVTKLEESIIQLLARYDIKAHLKKDAPGVYVNNAKICSIGLRVKNGCTYHGLSLNHSMDLEPFTRINPCGFQGMQVTQISDLSGPKSISEIHAELVPILIKNLCYQGPVYE